MKILIDMDGVLVDLVGGVIKVFGLDPINIYDKWIGGKYDLLEVLEKDRVEGWEYIAKLGAIFWEQLNWTSDGISILKYLESVFPIESMCLLTSPTHDPMSAAGKILWIQKNMDYKWHRRFLIGPAKHFCSHHQSLLIDDSDTNVKEFVRDGGYGLLIPRLWNRLYESKDRVMQHLVNNISYWKSNQK